MPDKTYAFYEIYCFPTDAKYLFFISHCIELDLVVFIEQLYRTYSHSGRKMVVINVFDSITITIFLVVVYQCFPFRFVFRLCNFPSRYFDIVRQSQLKNININNSKIHGVSIFFFWFEAQDLSGWWFCKSFNLYRIMSATILMFPNFLQNYSKIKVLLPNCVCIVWHIWPKN